jgi:hypothetical protein
MKITITTDNGMVVDIIIRDEIGNVEKQMGRADLMNRIVKDIKKAQYEEEHNHN